MALDADRLGNALADRVLTFMPDSPIAEDETALRNLMKALADEIVSEFVSFGIVSSSGATGVGPPGGPLPITGLPGTIS